MPITLNRHSSVPLYRQLVNALREDIVSGALAANYKLPPERELAERLGVNRATVLQAYQQLKSEGLIASHVGRGTFVCASDDRQGGAPPWQILFSDYSNRFTYHDIAAADQAQQAPDAIDFATGSQNPADIPDDLLRSVSIRAFESADFHTTQESPIEGFPQLRELLADHMTQRGVRCDADNVMVLSGAEQGLDLCVRAFVNPGDCVLVEQSTFFPALQAFRSADARVIGVPIDEHGMRTDLLDGYCKRFHPKLIFTIPTFQNPSGATMPLRRRRELVETAMRYQCLVIEDDPYGELCYSGRPDGAMDAGGHGGIDSVGHVSIGQVGNVRTAGNVDSVRDAGNASGVGNASSAGNASGMPSQRPRELTPLKGMENAGYVIYLSTFSKTVTPGLRTGWLVADSHVIARIAALRRMIDQHTSSSSQLICMELLSSGRIGRHIGRLCEIYGNRRNLMLDALRRYAPDGMRWSTPLGGYYLWARLPDGLRAARLLDDARHAGVTFMPGDMFAVDEDDSSHIRLNFVRPDSQQIAPGIRLLCDTIAEAARGTDGRGGER
ncbi:MAG: PLP-dependent aminotransferase family protein [Bifidobacterium sp.]|uniref:aminotransferase-like domain-containing protein n=1 Tax=Bifidobacterium sp. TaxID=41200 RepID=UPI003F03EC14